MSIRPDWTLVAMSSGATAPLGLAQANRAMAETAVPEAFKRCRWLARTTSWRPPSSEEKSCSDVWSP